MKRFLVLALRRHTAGFVAAKLAIQRQSLMGMT
jgi:hypothetical protein